MTTMTSEPTTLEHWTQLAGNLQPRTGVFIDGEFRAAASGATFDSINPATGELLAAVAAADEPDVDAAVVAARAAFESGVWSQTPPAHRKRVLLRLAELIIEHRAELALLDSMDMGKLVTEAHTVDVPSAADLFAFYGEALDKINGEIAPTEPGNLALVTREPLGVVGAVTPWNFPLDLAVWKLAPALAVGQQRRPQTRRAGAAVVAAAGRAGRRGGPARRRSERRPRARPHRGRAARPAPRRRRLGLHRLDRDRASGSCTTRPTRI